MLKTSADLKDANATLEGRLSSTVLTQLLIFVDGNPVMAEEDQEKMLNGLGDWCGL